MSELVKQRKPKWLRVKLPTGENYKHVRKLVSEHNLHTMARNNVLVSLSEKQ